MSLYTAFKDYVSSGFDKAKLSQLHQAFQQNNCWDESFLLEQYLANGEGSYIINIPQSYFLGRRAWVSENAPTNAAAGDVWYDLKENAASLLIPSESITWLVNPPLHPYEPFRCWLSVRPVKQWQFFAWKNIQQNAPTEVTDEDANKPVTGVSLQEAKKYAAFFGKRLPDHTDWKPVLDFVSQSVFEYLWEDQTAEWSGLKSYVDEDYALAVTPENTQSDPDEELEAYQHNNEGEPIGKTVFLRETTPDFMGFRTATEHSS